MTDIVAFDVPAETRPRNAAARVFLSDLLGYGLCGGAALALDWGLLILLVKLGVHYLAAAATSFMAGMLLAYVGSVALVFKGRRTRGLAAEAFGFFLVGFIGLVFNQALIFVFVHFGGLHVGVAKAPTAACVFVFNFLARRALLFSRSSPI